MCREPLFHSQGTIENIMVQKALYTSRHMVGFYALV